MEFTSQEHMVHFSEFCRYEMKTGGPDPQIKMVAKLSNGLSWEERIWHAGVYISVYNVPFAEMLWSTWPWIIMKDVYEDSLKSWFVANWRNSEDKMRIVTRTERRCVRKPEAMADFFIGYMKFCKKLPLILDSYKSATPEVRYMSLWNSCLEVPYIGRYVALKLLEGYKMFCDIDLIEPDIRPRDGWSPRTTLNVLFPKANIGVKSNDKEDIEKVNSTVRELQKILIDDYNLPMSLFQIQVVLCEYRESYDSKRQYPGRSLDSELSYWFKMHYNWSDFISKLIPIRIMNFPNENLGELNGWNGPRDELGPILSTYGYTWSDSLYDYNQTKARDCFQNPVRRDI
jgi:hypothetical protein